MLSSVCRQRESLAMMDSTVAVQTKGFGFLVPGCQELGNRLLQMGHAGERAAGECAWSSIRQTSARPSSANSELRRIRWQQVGAYIVAMIGTLTGDGFGDVLRDHDFIQPHR